MSILHVFGVSDQHDNGDGDDDGDADNGVFCSVDVKIFFVVRSLF